MRFALNTVIADLTRDILPHDAMIAHYNKKNKKIRLKSFEMF